MSQWATVVLKEQPDGGLYELYANGDQSQPLTSVTVGGQYRVLSAGPWLLANQWTHLAATYDGSTQRLYVSGHNVASRAQSGSIEVSNGALRIGGNSLWGEFFQGRIDEVRVYNRALSATEVNTDMNGPIASSPPPLPDVIVTSLSYASGAFTSTVKNQGTAATPAGIAIGVGYSVDGVFRTWGGSGVPPIAAGASLTIYTDGGLYTIPKDPHTITADVDDVNRFAESDETNNKLSRSITVP